MTVRKRHIRMALAAGALLVAGGLTHPATAQTTAEQLEAAKARLAELQAEAQAATVAFEAARSRLFATQHEAQETREAIVATQGRIAGLQEQLGERARQAYEDGATETIELLLEADSFSEFSDRMVFLDRIQQSDTDLVVRLDVLTEELRRKEADLARLEAEQARAAADLEREAIIIYRAVNEAQAIRDQYAAQYASEQRALAFLVTGTAQIFPGSALQACPAPGSYFTDTWGAPRSGGRYHQGVDMMAPYGHPVLAAQTGSVSYGSSSLGGLQAYVYGDSGDVTYYAHMQAFVGGARHVQAGEQIGEVGDTGNATGTPHLHFEYHPGGGSAINPTPYVAAVC